MQDIRLCASALVSLSDVQLPSIYRSQILNGPINKLYLIFYEFMLLYSLKITFTDPGLVLLLIFSDQASNFFKFISNNCRLTTILLNYSVLTIVSREGVD